MPQLANAPLLLALLTVWTLHGCSSDETCPATCDQDCDGVVDLQCSIQQTITPEGGTLQITDGPLAGFSLEIPPGALETETEISMEVRVGQDLQAEPWVFSTNAAEGDTMLYMDTWQTLYEVLEDWGKFQHYDLLFIIEQLRHEGLGESQYTFHFEPSGLQFSKPVQLQLPYGDDQSPGAQELWPALRIGHWSTQEESARLLEGTVVDPEAKTIRAPMLHFSDFQVKNGIANALSRLGGVLPNESTLFVKLIGLGLINGFDDSGESVGLSDISKHAKDLANELLCDLAEADFSLPEDAKWNELMAVLSTMPSLFAADHPDANQFKTGFEKVLAESIIAHPSKVSFAKSFEFSMQLNGNNVFGALMTMHNLGQGAFALDSHYEPMTNIHPSITDVRGAHYHMAGLAALALFTNGDSQSFAFGLGDEAIMSGVLQQAFEPGELIANLIGSQLMGEWADWDNSTCRQVTGTLSACDAGQSLAGETLTIQSNCGRSWSLTTDSNGSITVPSVPVACSSLWLQASIDGTTYSSQPVSNTPEDTNINLGELTLPVLPTAIEGFVFDDQIPPRPVEGAIAVHEGFSANVDVNGVFTIEEHWVRCDLLVASASRGTTEADSTATQPRLGVTSVGVITLPLGTVLVSNLSGTETNEDGSTVSFDLTLLEDPGDRTVSVEVISLDETEGLVSPAQVTFASGTWDVPQEVIVTGQPDDEFDGPVAYQIHVDVTDPIELSKPTFVNLINIDNNCSSAKWINKLQVNHISPPLGGSHQTQCSAGTETNHFTSNMQLSGTYDLEIANEVTGGVLASEMQISVDEQIDDLYYRGEAGHTSSFTANNSALHMGFFNWPQGMVQEPLFAFTATATATRSMDDTAIVNLKRSATSLKSVQYRWIPSATDPEQQSCEIVFEYRVSDASLVTTTDVNATVLENRSGKNMTKTYVDGVLSSTVESEPMLSTLSQNLFWDYFLLWTPMGDGTECEGGYTYDTRVGNGGGSPTWVLGVTGRFERPPN